MSFQIFSIDSPDYIKKLLPAFGAGNTFTANELAQKAEVIGMSIHPRRSRHLLQVWYVLGFLDRINDEGRAYRYNLSSFGTELLNNLRFNEALAIELAHWAWYSAWLRAPDFEKAWSWLYQNICNMLWESSPSEISIKHLIAQSLDQASSIYPNQKPALDSGSIGSVLAWLSTLTPPFISRQSQEEIRGSLFSQKREFCSPELVFLAIQLQYITKKLPINTPLLIDQDTIETICKICLLDTERFWEMITLCTHTFTSIIRRETVYGNTLTITEFASFTPPEPR